MSQEANPQIESSEEAAFQSIRHRRRFLLGSALTAGIVAALPSAAVANTRTPVEPAADRVNPAGRFSGKVVLITGATSGIGEGTAVAFAREGAKVVFNGRREQLGRRVESRIRSFGGTAHYIRTDVRREDEVEAFVREAIRLHGRIDVAFNNAGVVNPTLNRLHEIGSAEFNDVMNTNTLGTFLSLKYELPHMLRQGGGVIINTASVSSHLGFADIGPYSVSKHGVLGLTKVAAKEYAKDNIRIMSISPGGVDTPMLREVRAKRGLTMEAASKFIPIQRTNTVEEIARLVMFLASDEASAMHGSLVDVTSGMLD